MLCRHVQPERISNAGVSAAPDKDPLLAIDVDHALDKDVAELLQHDSWLDDTDSDMLQTMFSEDEMPTQAKPFAHYVQSSDDCPLHVRTTCFLCLPTRCLQSCMHWGAPLLVE